MGGFAREMAVCFSLVGVVLVVFFLVKSEVSGLVVKHPYGFPRDYPYADRYIIGVPRTPEGIPVLTHESAARRGVPLALNKLEIPELVCPERMQALSARDHARRSNVECTDFNEYLGVYCCTPKKLGQVTRRTYK